MSTSQQEELFRWIVGGLCVFCMVLSGVIWASLNASISDLRSDVRVLQTEVSDGRVVTQDLKTRVGALVDALNSQEATVGRHRRDAQAPQ